MIFAAGIGEPEGQVSVIRQKKDKDDGDVSEVAVDVLKNQRPFLFAAIIIAGLADAARRGVLPKRLVVSAAIVVASKTKAAGRPEN